MQMFCLFEGQSYQNHRWIKYCPVQTCHVILYTEQTTLQYAISDRKSTKKLTNEQCNN